MVHTGLRVLSLVTAIVLTGLTFYVAPVAIFAPLGSAVWNSLEIGRGRGSGKSCDTLGVLLIEALLCVAGPACIAAFVIEAVMNSLPTEATGLFSLILVTQSTHTLSHMLSLAQACSTLRHEAQPQQQPADYSDSEKAS